MAVYLISRIDVLDKERHEEYRERGQALMESHGGRYLVSGGRTTALRGDWSAQRLTIIEFDDADSLDALLASDELARLQALAADTITGDLIRIEGI